jgi:predicted anti-sigma-YlaC factor YlaD
MQCREILTELDAYLTNELDADASAAVERHLEACAGCRAELELLRKENALYHEYASAIDIPDDVSDRFPAQSGRPKSVIHGWRWAAAAAVLVAAFLSWRFYPFRQDAEGAGNHAGGQAAEMPVPVNQALSSYEQAVLLLQASYDGKKPNLDPTLVRELDRDLGVAGAAVAECRLALEKHPDNPQVIEFLLLGYEKQLGILKQIAEAL